MSEYSFALMVRAAHRIVKSECSFYGSAVAKVSDEYRAARRGQILTAAAARFAAEGFHRTSMQDVITATGLSPGGVYRYFRSKDEIIRAISLDVMEAVQELVREALRTHQPIPDLVAGLPLAIAGLHQADDRMRLAVQAWGEALRNPDLAAAMQEGLAGVRGALRDRIAMGQQHSDVAAEVDPDVMAGVLLSLIQGFILQRAWNPSVSADDYANAVHDVIVGLLGKPAPAGQQRRRSPRGSAPG